MEMLERLAGRKGKGQVQATAFFGKTYGEAMSLLLEARDYLTYGEPVDRARLSQFDQLRLCCETMRLTTRLTEIMAWLLAQRAIHAGELTQAEALGHHRALGDVSICIEELDAAETVMPRGLVSLLERSRALYIRVARLDELARRQLH